MTAELSTKAKAILEARDLLQCYGYNGFSFQHVANRLGLRKQSLYVHFKSKEDLGQDLLDSYATEFENWTKTVSVFDPISQIAAWFDIFYAFACDRRKLCPIGALISDFNSLPKSLQKHLTQLINQQRDWLENLVQAGQKEKSIRKDFSPACLAQMIMALAYGAQQKSRAFLKPNEVKEIKATTLALIKA